MASFVVSSETASDGMSSSTCSSSYDYPADDYAPGETSRRTEVRLYVLNRAGTGEVQHLLLGPEMNDILTYRARLEVWKPLVDVLNFSVVVVDNYLYVLGGFDRTRAVHLNRVLRYDASENLWLKCAPMLVPRAKCATCAQGGNIYVTGGEKTDGRLTGSCEVYDIETDTWTKSGMMVSARANHACAVYGKEMYCAGGSQGNKSHNNLWLYEEHRWKELDEHYPHLLPYTLDRFAIATVDNTLYFTGGVTSRVSRKSPNNPEFSTQRRLFSFTTGISAGEDAAREHLISPWDYKLPAMSHARHSHGTVALGSKVYVLGGSSLETGQPVPVCESYNTKTRQWEDDFRFRKGDISNVTCVILEVHFLPVLDRKLTNRLKWVLW